MWTAGEAGSGLICGSVACDVQQIAPSQPSQSPARRLQSFCAEPGELAWGRLWPNITDVVMVRDELGEQLCVWEQGWVVLFPQSLVCSTPPLCDLLSFCFSVLASPLPENRHMVCCQLDTQPRLSGATGVRSSQDWECDVLTSMIKNLQLHVIFNFKVLTKSNVSTVFY